MFDFEYPLTLADYGTLIDPTISDIIEEHVDMMEDCENGNRYCF